MTMITKTSGSYPSVMQGVITFNAGGTGNYTKGETVTGSSFSAKVVKWDSTARKLTIKKIVGNPTAAGTITGGTSSAAWVVATINTANVGGINVYTGGWNLRETPSGITRSKIAGSRTLIEVMLAEQNMSVTRGDFATPATFTLTGGAWSAATTYHYATGDAITFTIISSEPVVLPTGTTFAVTVGGTGRTATLSASNAAGTTHTFSYPVIAGDAGAGLAISVAAGNFTLPANTKVYEVADDGSQKALTAPVAVGGSLANKTGVTIAS